jgi:sugar phosphate isomerase/epimerase
LPDAVPLPLDKPFEKPYNYGMNNIITGISSACFYPALLEDAVCLAGKLSKCLESGAIEIFVNVESELSGVVFDRVRGIVSENGLKVVSMHPFTTFESNYWFSEYIRRKEAFLDVYKRYFSAMNVLGAKVFVTHGMSLKIRSVCEDGLYFERFAELSETGRTFGVTVTQENVCYCKSGSLDFLRKMKENLGETARFTLDLKQCVRSGLSPLAVLKALGANVIHIHASDNSSSDTNRDCLLIGAGNFDFAEFFSELRILGYGGAVILELYENNYDSEEELRESLLRLQSFSAPDA